ncbi:MAG: hypothetical protein LBP59_02205 [Planctomycetaceae bacterium]|nr:hypothetical protein [Planctomycetaceae bacterium]
MTIINTNIDVAGIVQKILADLNIKPEIAAKSNSLTEVSENKINKNEISKNEISKNGIDGEELLIDGGRRVISLEDVRRSIEGSQNKKITKFVIPPKCILTPSAKDEIKNQGLKIIVRNNNNIPLWLALHDNLIASTTLLKQLQTQYNLIQNQFTNLSDLVNEAVKITRQKNYGVILTQHPATILRLTSLRETLRVILAIEPKQVSIDAKEINANLMIASPARINESNIIKAINEYVKNRE